MKADPIGRLKECREMVELAEKYADEMCKAERLHAQGLLPKRICHCDTKVSNVLFDRDGDVLCVSDLGRCSSCRRVDKAVSGSSCDCGK